MDSAVGWVPTSAWAPTGQGALLSGAIPPAHAPQGCHLLALLVIALFFLPLNKYPFSSQPPSRHEAKQARKTVVGRVVGERRIPHRAALVLPAWDQLAPSPAFWRGLWRKEAKLKIRKELAEHTVGGRKTEIAN